MRLITDDERRARIGRRHALATSDAVADVEQATRAVTVLHATEPATVYLSAWARVPGLSVDDVDRALYVDRSLVKQLAMRRTLFVFPRDLLPAAWGSASARVAGVERTRMAKDIVKIGIATDGGAWVDQARAEVLELLADVAEGLPAQAIREAIAHIDVRITEASAGMVWGASRVLTHLGLTGDLVRAANTGHWRVSRPRWTLMRHWLDVVPEPWSEADGYRELVRRWLYSFGPGTVDDAAWWLGSTKTAVRQALAELQAVQVELEGGAAGWVLPDDLDVVESPEPWVALLPVLDPTVMGWKGRDFYLGPHREQLFDRTGNAGTTAWVDGRVVGCWVQDDDARVRLHLLEKVPARARRALESEAERLTDWLDGVKIGTVYPSIAMKEARG